MPGLPASVSAHDGCHVADDLGATSKAIHPTSAGNGQGDRVYLWESGRDGGIVAIAEVLDEVADRALASGLSKRLRSMGLMPSSLYQITTQWNGKKKVRSFSLVGHFKAVAAANGWPDDWKGRQENTEL